MMYRASLAVAAALLVPVASSSSGAREPLAGQRVTLKHIAPCVRLLNNSGTIGCATPSRGILAPLHVATSEAELTSLVNDPADEGISIAITPALFHSANLGRLRDALGVNLMGVLVLHADTPPAGIRSPTAASAWNPAGDGLSTEHFPFAIVLLGPEESDAVLSHAPASASDPPLADLRFPMSAREDAPKCLAAGSCLPVGGRSVWSALSPRTSAASMPASAERPAVALAVGLDAVSFFHDDAPGAYAAAAPLAALLAAVDSVVATPGLAAQLPGLPTSPLAFAFTAEAWGELGSRRFLADVRNFTCQKPSAASAPAPPIKDGERPVLPDPPGCEAPRRSDVRFTALHHAPIKHLVQIAPIGAASPHYVHTALLRAGATAPSGPIQRAAASLGLPPGPARSFVDPKWTVKGNEGTDVATVGDFAASYHGAARYASRFDTRDALNDTLVCEAASVAARAFWDLSGGHGVPVANCTLVSELLGCLLPNASALSRPKPCALAQEFGIKGGLGTRYAGVYAPSELLPTAAFAHAFLNRTLAKACDAAVPSRASPCEPVVMYHRAHSAGIEQDDATGAWRTTDPSEPIWAESNWPPEMHVMLYPHGAPRTAESVLLVSAGLASALLTYGAVVISRVHYKEAYKRL